MLSDEQDDIIIGRNLPMNSLIYGIILAAGKGTRFKAKNLNKTAAIFNSKPLVYYGVSLLESIVDKTYVVIGSQAQSVKDALSDKKDIIYVYQRRQLGTGHATSVAVSQIEKANMKPEYVILGYGDHMMFYTKEIVRDMISTCRNKQAAITLISSIFKNPGFLGRIKRDSSGKVSGIIEFKDASDKEKDIKEINAGFYCFRYDFLKNNYRKLKKSPITGEYYVTDLIAIAIAQKLPVETTIVPYIRVGIGINSQEELTTSAQLYSQLAK